MKKRSATHETFDVFSPEFDWCSQSDGRLNRTPSSLRSSTARERERERERAREKKAVQEMNQSSTVSLILNLIQDEIINQFPPTKTRNH